MRVVLIAVLAVLSMFIISTTLWAFADYMSIEKEKGINYVGATDVQAFTYSVDHESLFDIYERHNQEQKDKDNYEQIRVETARTRGENLKVIHYEKRFDATG